MDLYDKLGVRKIINAWGTITLIGGSLMPPEVLEAMVEAGKHYVNINELHQKAGDHLAKLIGVEGAYISCGAASGMVLAAAAFITGKDRERILRLPDTSGLKNEIIVRKRPGLGNYVYQGMEHTGARLVEVGTPETWTIQDMESGLSERTVAIQLYWGRNDPPLEDVVALARGAGVRVLIDAAAEAPPRRNLTEPLEKGADLIVFSGGKGLSGPQCTGLILGKKDLIEACAMNSNPNSSLGRPMKVGKEEIAGLVRAVELFLEQDEQAVIDKCARRATYIAERLKDIPHIKAGCHMADLRARAVLPGTFIEFEEPLGLTPQEVRELLLEGEPSIGVGSIENGIRIYPWSLQEGEVEIVVQRLREVLA